MPPKRWMSYTQLRCYTDCPRMYRYRYVDRYPVDGTRPAALVAGDLLHRALAVYHSILPKDDKGAIECVRLAITQSDGAYSDDEIGCVKHDVMGHVLNYHNARLDVIGSNCRCEVPLSAQVGPVTLGSRADAVWRARGTIGECDWKMSMPPMTTSLMQATFIHAGLRARFPDVVIEHYVIALRPTVVVRRTDLTKEAFQSSLATILRVAREIGADQVFAPTPGRVCAYCAYADKCEAMTRAVEFADF